MKRTPLKRSTTPIRKRTKPRRGEPTTEEKSMESCRGQVELYERVDRASQDLVLGLKVWLLDGYRRDIRTETDVIEFQKTPWQFFKQKYAPSWFVRRWPVVTENRQIRVSVHHHYVCPHVSVDGGDKLGNFIHFRWMGEMSGQIPEGSGCESSKDE